MKKLVFLVVLILSGCNKPDKKAEFKGIWIDKSLLEHKAKHELANADSLARFPLILFKEEKTDSVLFYYDKSKRNFYPAEYSYNSYFVHFDKTNEYFLAPDYTTGEMLFSNLKDDEFYRFVKIKTDLTYKDVLSPSFNIDSLVRQNVK